MNTKCPHCIEGYVQDTGFTICNHCNGSGNLPCSLPPDIEKMFRDAKQLTSEELEEFGKRNREILDEIAREDKIMKTIKEIVKDNHVTFNRYRKGILYYIVHILKDDAVDEDDYEVYEFPVPIEDCGDADFLVKDRAILFMRYIRKALDDGTFVKVV